MSNPVGEKPGVSFAPSLSATWTSHKQPQMLTALADAQLQWKQDAKAEEGKIGLDWWAALGFGRMADRATSKHGGFIVEGMKRTACPVVWQPIALQVGAIQELKSRHVNLSFQSYPGPFANQSLISCWLLLLWVGTCYSLSACRYRGRSPPRVLPEVYASFQPMLPKKSAPSLRCKWVKSWRPGELEVGWNSSAERVLLIVSSKGVLYGAWLQQW